MDYSKVIENLDQETIQKCLNQIENAMARCPDCGEDADTGKHLRKACIKHKKMVTTYQ